MAALRSASEALRRSKRAMPMKSWTSQRWKGLVSEGVDVYSPGRRRKKKAVQAMSATAQLSGVLEVAATLRAWMITEMGMGLTRAGGGSARV